MTALQRLNGGIIRLHAYPAVGRRIKLSQGSGTVRAVPTSSIWSSLTVRGREHDKFVVGPLRRGESVLGEAQERAAGMVECTKSAFADLNGLLIPGFGEEWALTAQRFDEGLDLRVAKRMGEIGAKFGEQASRPVFPGRNQHAGGMFEKHVPQQVALTVPVQPAVKEPRGSVVPAAGVPKPVKSIGRVLDRFDCGDQCRWRICRGSGLSLGIETPRKPEK